MASNKECLVVIIDVREGNNKEFKEKAIRCAADILKDKICAERKDFVTFILMGTKRSKNKLNTTSPVDYLNIVEYPQPELPTWQLFCNFFKFVNEEEPGTEADWLDALIVALEVQHDFEGPFKCPHRRILLFHDFDDCTKDFNDFECISNTFLEKEIGLIVVSNKIGYVTNPKTSEPQAIFIKSKNHTQDESKSEIYALRLVSECNARICNFDEALFTSFKLSNSRPWTWNGNLVIGSKISIAIAGVIAIKDENNIKLKKCWGASDELPSREMRTYVKGIEMEPLDVDIINGYMLGATPIPFDESVEDMEDDKTHYQTGLKFLGFPKLNSIPEEYYCGDSLYWIVHRKGMEQSAKKLDALVQALHNTSRAMLCWKIYSAKHNTPKLVVLLPNESHADRPASLSMIELTYHAQHHYWDFPTLITERTKCNKTQLNAIDDLIDSMDLMLIKVHEPRRTYESELLAVNTLPHIFERNMMDILERKVLCTLSEDEEQFQKMLEKNFVEAYWQTPEINEEAAKQAAGKIRDLFPLEKTTQSIKTKVDPSNKFDAVNNISTADNGIADEALSIECVGLKTPDEDFEKLLKHRVIPLKDKTNRDKQFHIFAAQMRSVLWRLIFENTTLEAQKIAEAMFVYRKCCYDFNAFADYNEWISDVKTAVQVRKDLHMFWFNVVKDKNLGLCFIGQPTIEELIKIDDFFQLDTPSNANNDVSM